mmetsp:Transcript_15438/g.60339  ORF Transcript_15438/g.60339 Transcript_15438/m.60339 type:complete len:2177 (-) Transcript_15438:96-6626(-)|eukprot:CAMPEP_0114608562 /NCGR_PEP_ID=MMETSP0168-20121206/2642_1 /TAXON_ID=95228 ORGANISM="Vannella sp., Strain DIVA3 517/6/12" /NCGR_SAMPLE_ID=MMETSP0168 /ASSEMBLY_ACC=CAM_ASM_000044 /LENGTH=2176 /DNA_ID=CAMNT_0001819463 /DNA_START=86 /DNA_END=6616 /DNA_ORIENTATION=+
MSDNVGGLRSSSTGKCFSSVEEYVKTLGGSKVITKVLIANNGIAAVKGIRSIRQWAYNMFGNERAISFVVMATPEDLRANAEYIRMADQFEEVAGGSNNNNYANVPLIIDIAQRNGVQAVWAGWGHASENPRLPETLSKTDIAFIGPGAKAMEELGDKINSTIIAQSADVSCVPWSGSDVEIEYTLESGVPKETQRKACVETYDEALSATKKIGYPVMIKASEGGGGKGIRKVTQESELEAAFRMVQGEVPGSPIFVMRMVPFCHHLEVQVLGDEHGNAISIHGRDCSVQRRHQKIIEEGPAIAADPKIFREMEKAAVRLAKSVHYAGAGTVEYLYGNDGYFFLELNPRLQVEHPVTEWISGVNLPAAQLQVAMGIPLSRIPSIRRLYGKDPFESTPIDFDNEEQVEPNGHVIACRITAENPEDGFKPTSGNIQELIFRSMPSVWGYFSVQGLGEVHEFADSQFGHLFAWGETRDDARKSMVLALKELSIRGDIRTGTEYLVGLLEREDFGRLDIHTGWLDEILEKERQSKGLVKEDPMVSVICGAVYKAFSRSKARREAFTAYLLRGQVPPTGLLVNHDDVELIFNNVKYSFICTRVSAHKFKLRLDDSVHTDTSVAVEVDVHALTDGGLLAVLDERCLLVYGKDEPLGLRLTIEGKTCIFTTEYDPTNLRSATAGKLVRYLVKDGSLLKAGTPFAEMEVMKMYMPLITTEEGTIHFNLSAGSVLHGGETIATLELVDPSSVKKATLYAEDLPTLKPPRRLKQKKHQQLRAVLSSLENTMEGYPSENVRESVQLLIELLNDRDLPILQFRELLSNLSGRLPKQVDQQVSEVLDKYEFGVKNLDQLVSSEISFPGQAILDIIQKYEDSIKDPAEIAIFRQTAEPIQSLAKTRVQGPVTTVICSFLHKFLEVERTFEGKTRDEVFYELRQKYDNEWESVFTIAMSRSLDSCKYELIQMMLDMVATGKDKIEAFVPILHDLADLSNQDCADVSVKARQLLIQYQLPSFKQRQVAIEDCLRRAYAEANQEERFKHMNALIDQSASLFDVLVSFLSHSNEGVRKLAMELYVRRSYKAYSVGNVTHRDDDDNSMQWSFHVPHAVEEQSPSVPRKAGDEPEEKKSGGMRKVESVDELFHDDNGEEKTRTGLMVVYEDFRSFYEKFSAALSRFAPESTSFKGESINVVNACIVDSHTSIGEQAMITRVSEFLRQPDVLTRLKATGVRRVTLVLGQDENFPQYYTFRERLNFAEDPVTRHTEPPLAYHMELSRLSNYGITYIPTLNRQIHLYHAIEKDGTASRFFVRAVVRPGDSLNSSLIDLNYIVNQAEKVMVDAIKSLEVAVRDKRFAGAQNHHIFLKVITEVSYEPESVKELLKLLGDKYGKRLWKLRVGALELAGRVRRGSSANNLRFTVVNPTGYLFDVNGYLEIKDQKSQTTFLSSITGQDAPDDSKPVTHPYPLVDKLQKKRFIAQNHSTTYCYDFPTLFKAAIIREWSAYKKLAAKHGETISRPHKVMMADELILGEDGELEETDRKPGNNDIAMVAWRMRILTPSSPKGREFILVANDITQQIGSFGPKEDELFNKVSMLAREEGIPRIYVACNSGARIGLAKEAMDAFQVEWEDPSDFSKGFKYLFVDDETKAKLGGSVITESEGPNKHRITDVIGLQDGLGVENLRGSGMIAGETSRAYEEVFTATLVTGRTVGIGAYLVRLGQRTIQNQAPIILTGAHAINKLLGMEVYRSNVQLGGLQIMYRNGVSHIEVPDDYRAAASTISWLAFVPEVVGQTAPRFPLYDPVDRDIQFTPSKSAYNPVHMLAGRTDADGNWESGFFDEGSWIETLGGWAMTVICGRARLGGIPVGVIAVETRTVEQVVPADPANPESQEVVKVKAGQVWYPDSAYKTAQAINDFNYGEELPLIIFANWRGFSGGMRDMFDEILKFGSYIVDNLRKYKHPIFVYIPPFGELRGGAWVVLDPTINLDMMEIYCDRQGSGGVLEANGTVEIKFRMREQRPVMHRLDEKLRALDAKLAQANDPKEIAELKAEIAKREHELHPVYQQVATQFCALHDTAGRMKAKGVIREVIDWKNARRYFYHRLRRRLADQQLRKQIAKAKAGLSFAQATDVIRSWVADDVYNSDASFTAWAENPDNTAEKIKELQRDHIRAQLESLKGLDADLFNDVLKTL